MNMTLVYTSNTDGKIRHIFTSGITGAAEANTSLVARFDAENYPDELNWLNANVDSIAYSNSGFWLDGLEVITPEWIAARETEIEQEQQEQSAETELAATFAYIRQHLPGLKVLQLKMLGYVQTFGDDPDNFGITQLGQVYADLKATFALYPYCQNRLKLFIKRRAFGQGISTANISAMFTRINEGTETNQDKALIWDAAETLIAQATTAALLSK